MVKFYEITSNPAEGIEKFTVAIKRKMEENEVWLKGKIYCRFCGMAQMCSEEKWMQMSTRRIS